MSRLRWVVGMAALAGVGCTESVEVGCIDGYALCGEVCVAVATDRENCGACGVTCGAYEACEAGACVPDCLRGLHGPVSDAWGYAWDGLERPAATFAAARDACEGIGGRLPGVSELVRVSAAKSGTVGDTYMTHTLWSVTTDSASVAYTVRLDNGGVVPNVATNAYNYRCVCPPPPPGAYVEEACYGPAGGGCAALGGDARFNLDAEDRPALSKAGAIHECALAGGELPSAERLAAAVAAGLPNGSNVAMHTSDDAGHAAPVCVAWVWGTCVAYDPPTDQQRDALLAFTAAPPTFTEGAVQTARPFRCIGPAEAGAAVPGIADGFVEPRGERVIDGTDRAPTTYTAALWDCFGRGGHLPTAAELAAFAAQGLPSGDVTGARWTSDQGGSGYVATYAWSGSAHWPVDPALAQVVPTTHGVAYVWGTTSVSKLAKADAAGLPYRCVYYAVDPAFPVPAASSCSGNACFAVSAGAAGPVPRMWFDAANRGGTSSDTWTSAAAACGALGARLPSARDLVEAIRSGLPGTEGTDALVTSDLVRGPAALTIGWTGSDNAGWTDSITTTAGLTATGVKYRCMWTNEIR